jgi:hypothetical protein
MLSLSLSVLMLFSVCCRSCITHQWNATSQSTSESSCPGLDSNPGTFWLPKVCLRPLDQLVGLYSGTELRCAHTHSPKCIGILLDLYTVVDIHWQWPESTHIQKAPQAGIDMCGH